PIVVTADITAPYTCDNSGATITASATGGTPGYEYQLEDVSGTPIAGFEFRTNPTFTNVPDGEYVVRAMDVRNCDDAISTVQTVQAPIALTFTATPTACYSGNNDGEIEVSVTGGNGGLLFRINGGPFQAPSPVMATTYTFTNLGSGDHTIEVRDQYGCTVPAEHVNIAPVLRVSASGPAIRGWA